MKYTIFILLIFCALITFSQPKKPEINDFLFSLHEESINKVLTAIGEISGSKDYEVLLIKGTYHWKIQNSKINIKPDSSDFTCDAIVNVGPFNYKTKVPGTVKISYDPNKNLIYIKITRAIFDLYTIVFGKKLHIKDIHLEEYFREPFVFNGPRSMTTEMEFMMPDSSLKKIFVQPTTCKMEVKWKEICTSCEISATAKSSPPSIKIIPPIETIKPNTLDTTQPRKK